MGGQAFKPDDELIVKRDAAISDLMSVNKLSAEDSSFAYKYIEHYYNDPDVPLSFDLISDHVKTIQSQLGLEVNGVIDSQLVKTLEYTPRCGVSDFNKSARGQAVKWGQKTLTYYIEKYVKNLSTADQDDIIKTAFQNWTDVADIQFQRVTSKQNSNLVISTGSGRGDGFDGPSNTLAWAYLPPDSSYRGQLLMRFDLDETWIKNTNTRGILMLNVACHEFGHMLGLDHSRYQNALMAPYYSPNIPKPQAQDDVVRIQSLYGAPKPVIPTPPPSPPNPPVPPVKPGQKYKLEVEVDDLSKITINGKKLVDFSLI